ncbi:MAG: hypothetical protein OEY64_03155 [Nitrospinota bacterium]|nr:hypothetical protein [Nitrospinota bacterium]
MARKYFCDVCDTEYEEGSHLVINTGGDRKDIRFSDICRECRDTIMDAVATIVKNKIRSSHGIPEKVDIESLEKDIEIVSS